MKLIQVSLIVGAIALGGAALVAQPPAGQGQGGRGGRGGFGGGGGVQIKEGEECPAGMTEFRHLMCRAPEHPAPSIVDYRPRSTVVADAHLVPRAKYPVADIHTHGTSAFVSNPERVKQMDALNLRVLVDLSGGTDPAVIKQKVDAIRNSPYPDRFRVFANVNWEGAGGPGWKEKAMADLEQSVKNGAIGLKVF
jgi:hypothetical protein